MLYISLAIPKYVQIPCMVAYYCMKSVLLYINIYINMY